MGAMTRLVIAALMVWLPVQAAAVELVPTPRLRRFGISEGLPSRMVLALAQDRQGYIWAATDDGLARYDGRAMRVWQHDPMDAQSLPGNAVEAMLVDPHDRLWVGVNGAGLARMDTARDGFSRYANVSEQCPQEIWALAYAGQALWVGTSGAGICLLHEDGSVTRLQADANNPRALPDDIVFSMVSDADGSIWIGTGAGLARWRDGQFERIGEALLGQRSVIRLTRDRNGGVWAGTDEGLFRVSPEGVVSAAPWAGGDGLRSSVVLSDADGGYWVGTANGLLRARGTQLQLMQGNAGSGFLTADSGVLDLMEDREGGVWMALLTQGLAYLPPDWRRFSTYYQLGEKSLESRYLLNGSADGRGFLISGAEDLYHLDHAGVLSAAASKTRLGPQAAWSSLRRPDGSIWLGRVGRITVVPADASAAVTQMDLGTGRDPQHRVDVLRAAPDGTVWVSIVNVGLQQRSAQGQLLRQISGGGAEGLPKTLIEQLSFAADGTLYVAGGTGLLRWDGAVMHPVAGVTPSAVYDVSFAADGSAWLARSGALEHYRLSGGRWQLVEHLGHGHGVPAVPLGGLVVGDSGQVWATTPRGLVGWHPRQKLLKVYGERDGLSDVEFASRPPARDASGMAMAVSASGVVVFDPDAPPRLAAVPSLALAAVQWRDQASGHMMHGAPHGALVLSHDDRDLRVEARLLSYADPAQHRYRFWVRGFDSGWVEQGNQPERSLSKLAPGHYVVQVQAAMGDGPWSPIQQLAVTVQPPWWRSPLAYGVYAVLALCALAGGVWLLRRRLQRRARRTLEQQQRSVAEQALQAKTAFLATLGHEVRTPMTGVLGMSELLLTSSLDDTQRRYVTAIHTAGSHLLRLVNETLDLARIEAGRLELDNAAFELLAWAQDIGALMAPVAQQRGLRYVAQLPEQPTIVMGDALRLRQVVLNLVGNAIKFTEQGTVCLCIEVQGKGHAVRIAVTDTGPGIQASRLSRLFQRFEQADGTQARYGGSGLGLAISKELVEAMGGQISVQSVFGQGASFVVDVPLAWWLQPAPASDGLPEHEPPLRLLLVEDDPTVAEVICALLSARGHTVVHAAHGLAGLSSVATQPFDLAIFDLDLPALDGLALASQVRTLGYGLPLIAVTARADPHAEALARGAGFAGFLRKPVSGEMLGAAIREVWHRSVAKEEAR